jgi:hypothetical protein
MVPGSFHGSASPADRANRTRRVLLTGDLRAVYHGSPDRLTLQELTRAYQSVVEDSIRGCAQSEGHLLAE